LENEAMTTNGHKPTNRIPDPAVEEPSDLADALKGTGFNPAKILEILGKVAGIAGSIKRVGIGVRPACTCGCGRPIAVNIEVGKEDIYMPRAEDVDPIIAALIEAREKAFGPMPKPAKKPTKRKTE
jgi:hypothetical protein